MATSSPRMVPKWQFQNGTAEDVSQNIASRSPFTIGESTQIWKAGNLKCLVFMPSPAVITIHVQRPPARTQKSPLLTEKKKGFGMTVEVSSHFQTFEKGISAHCCHLFYTGFDFYTLILTILGRIQAFYRSNFEIGRIQPTCPHNQSKLHFFTQKKYVAGM